MKITSIKSHVLRYELKNELGYSQQYYKNRTTHLVEVETDEGITGWGECFGPGNIALANKFIVEKVIQPLIIGEDPTNKEYIWHKVYNLLRDSGQKGMPIQALSGVDIALWDILSKKAKLPLYQLIGGKCNSQIPVYGYGMMLQKKTVNELIDSFQEEAKQIKSKNFKAMKMKIGLGPKDDLKLVQAVREVIGKDYKLMVDANHAYNLNDALYVGKGLDELDIFWFEEPIAPEDYYGVLNTAAARVDSTIIWNDTAPTSTLFSLGNDGEVNGSGNTYIAYCFADVQGFSKFGSYIGNGNENGAFIYTGFRPAFTLVKQTDAVNNWGMCDNKRNQNSNAEDNGKGNYTPHTLVTNAAGAESSYGSGASNAQIKARNIVDKQRKKNK